jgi:hypothetical protein
LTEFEPDCRICEHFEYVSREWPSPDEAIFVHKYYRCTESNKIYFTFRELHTAYTRCSFRSERAKQAIVQDILHEIDAINLAFMQFLGGKKKQLIKVDLIQYLW